MITKGNILQGSDENILGIGRCGNWQGSRW